MILLKTLLLKFGGPLQSWGTKSDFETRHTDLYPSKSAVIGLLAASLGYRRSDTEKIRNLNVLDFAVRIDQEGGMLRDYHTAKSYKANGEILRTYVTNRYYIEDGIFIVALGTEDEIFIEKLINAIKKPYFQQFMGRRALPLPADFIVGVRECDVINALGNLDWQASEWYKRKYHDKKSLKIYSDAKLIPDGKLSIRRDSVVSFDQKSREFEYRYEAIETTEVRHYDTKEHDAFSAIGE